MKPGPPRNKIRTIISNNLKLDGKTIHIERAHRTGKPDANGRRHRPVVVKFLNYRDRASVLENTNKLKNTGIYINEDFSALMRERRKALLPQMYAARERGLNAYLKFQVSHGERKLTPAPIPTDLRYALTPLLPPRSNEPQAL